MIVTITTTKCSAAGHSEIAFDVDEHAAGLADWLVNNLETAVLAGVRFEIGQTIQVGWSLLQVQEGARCLELYEPDLDAMPIRWVKGINSVLRELHLQRAVCELFGHEPDFPSIRHASLVSPGFVESSEFTMWRDHPENSDSGWVFAEEGYDGPEGSLISLYHLALQKEMIIPFLALPELAIVRIGPSFVEVVCGERVKSSDDTDLLRQLANGWLDC